MRMLFPNPWKLLPTALCSGLLAWTGLAAGRFGPTQLRCEYQSAPLAVESLAPRLSWVVETGAGERGVFQSSYQVLVASSPELLQRDQGDLWDSGKVASN